MRAFVIPNTVPRVLRASASGRAHPHLTAGVLLSSRDERLALAHLACLPSTDQQLQQLQVRPSLARSCTC